MKRLEFLANKINDFNRKADAARASNETARLADLKSSRADLKQLVKEALVDLNRLKEKLAKEIFPSQ